MITARFAASQGRPVFAVPGSVHALSSRGPHRLLSEGALLTKPEDIFEVLGLFQTMPRAPAAPAGGPCVQLGPTAARVLAVLSEDASHIDAIVARSGCDAAAVAGALLALEVCGLVRHLPGKRLGQAPGAQPWWFGDPAGR